MIEQYLTSLEISKKLKELGIRKATKFVWWEFLDETVNKWQIALLTPEDYEKNRDVVKYALSNESYSAYLTDELLEMLPKKLEIEEQLCFLVIEAESPGIWNIFYYTSANDVGVMKEDYKLPDALGKMLICLKENNLLKEEKNER